MLRALYENGVTPDLLVATSAGALNATYVASRPQTVATTRELGRIWRDLERDDVFPLNPWLMMAGMLGKRDHLVPDDGIRSLVARHLQFEDLSESPIPLHLVAFDAQGGQEVLLSEGPAIDAVLGAAAIPGVLPPVCLDGRRLVDGGVVNNTPISHAVELGAERIYVLPTGYACALDEPPASALGMALHAISLLTHRRLIDDVERHRDDAHLVVLPPPCPLDVQPVDFGHAEELIARARRDTARFLDRGGEERPPIPMRMHRHDRAPEVRPAAPRSPTVA